MDATTAPGPLHLPLDLPPALLTALHLGPLHPMEQALVYLLAFGPFVVLALVVVVRRRQDRREEEAAAAGLERPAAAGPEGPRGDEAQRDR